MKKKVIALCIVLGTGLYLLNNSNLFIKAPASFANSESSNSTSISNEKEKNKQPNKVASVDSLIEGLQKRLEKDPNDLNGWVLLAKSYHHLQRWQEASEAFEKAKALGYSAATPQFNNISANNQSTKSLKHILSSKNNEFLAKAIDNAIDRDKRNNSEFNGINLSLSLASSVFQKVSPKHIVFIFSRSIEGGAPLAVVKKRVSDLPLEIRLDDSMAMMPNQVISKLSKVIVGARLSMSESPIRSTGDFEVLSKPISSNYKKNLKLEISHQLTELDLN